MAFDPRISEWENPDGAMPVRPPDEKIVRGEATRGTETSKYPEEEKSTEIARVAASESAQAQTHACVKAVRRCRVGCCGAARWGADDPRCGYKGARKRNGMGRPAEQGESPVREAEAAADPRPRVAPGT